MIICNQEAERNIRETGTAVLKALHLPSDPENLAAIEKKLLPFYQHYSRTIFKVSDDAFEGLCKNYRQVIETISVAESTSGDGDTGVSQSRDEEKLRMLQDMFDSSDFKTFCSNLFNAMIHMQLNEPKLRVLVEPIGTRKPCYRQYHKSKYILVDGFAQEGAPCIEIIPTVMRNNYAYMGIKPSVLMLSEESTTEEIRAAIAQQQDEQQIFERCSHQKEKNEAAEGSFHQEKSELQAQQEKSLRCSVTQPVQSDIDISGLAANEEAKTSLGSQEKASTSIAKKQTTESATTLSLNTSNTVSSRPKSKKKKNDLMLNLNNILSSEITSKRKASSKTK